MDRTKFIGASEVAALFDMHNFLTPRKLYHLKRGEIQEEDNPQMRRGRLIENAVISIYEEQHGVKLTVHQKNTPCPTVDRLAATPDTLDENGNIKEFKTTRFFREAQPLEAHIIQVNAQMMCLDGKKASVTYYDLVTDAFHDFPVERNDEICKLIESAVARFWECVDNGIPPKVSEKDLELLAKIFKPESGKKTDLTGDNYVTNLFAEYDTANDNLKHYTKEVDRIKAELRDKLEDAELLLCGDWQISNKIIQRKEYTVKASSYARMTITNKNKGE